jgi:hypothetical protein
MSKNAECYEGKAKLITARAKANATLIAALSGLLLAGGNFVNDFLDRRHQRQIDESAYNAAVAEIRALKSELQRHHGDEVVEPDPLPPPMARSMATAPVALVDSDAIGEEIAVITESESKDDKIEESKKPVALPKPQRDLVQAPSFQDIHQYVERSGKAMDFDSAKR